MNLSEVEERRKLSWTEQWAVDILRQGPIPKHIAIILDGNRRYARKKNLSNVLEGHYMGSKKLEEIVSILFNFGVYEVTVYAFSIENFKRSQDEVNGLMELLAKKSYLTQKRIEKIKKSGVCLEVQGNLELTPSKTLERVLRRHIVLSKEGRRMKINVAFIYTSRNEISKAANDLLQGLSMGTIETYELEEELFKECFTLHKSNPVDLLIRTSGECRLSDFMLWQSTEARCEFVSVTWPEFSFWGLCTIIFRYQHEIIYRRAKIFPHWNTLDMKPKVRDFLSRLRNKKWSEMIAESK